MYYLVKKLIDIIIGYWEPEGNLAQFEELKICNDRPMHYSTIGTKVTFGNLAK